MEKQITIVGSINTDLVCKCTKEPKMGETIIGDEFSIHSGGKGANEAVAISKLGGRAALIGCVGDDDFSVRRLNRLNDNGVLTQYIRVIKNTHCGIALITIAQKNNKIIVVKGANAHVDVKYIKSVSKAISESSIVGAQLEVPIESVQLVSEICKSNNVPFVFNPSPITKLPKELIDNSTYILVNEVEIAHIPGYSKTSPMNVLMYYPNKLILTMGSKGVYFYNGKKVVNIPAIKVKVVDTTGAGDTFMGSFMLAISQGKSMHDALVFANMCAGLKTTKLGAQTGMPTLKQVEDYNKSSVKNAKA